MGKHVNHTRVVMFKLNSKKSRKPKNGGKK